MSEITTELLKNNGAVGILALLFIWGLLWVRSMLVKYVPVALEWYTKHVIALEKQNAVMERMVAAVEKCEANNDV